MGRAEDVFNDIVERGFSAIEEFIITRKSEELFLDFKQSADHGDGERLHQNDRNNLAKAISGFGNSEGGVIVWGIDCRKVRELGDVANAQHPIRNVRRFVSWLEGVVSACTVPPHSGVRNEYVVSDGDDGFAITYIPKSQNTPHQSIVKNQYFIRAGSGFMPTPHSVLQGMFGKRPQPFVYIMYGPLPARVVEEGIEIQLVFLIGNHGPGIASDLFMNIKYTSLPGPRCELHTEQRPSGSWYYGSVAGVLVTAISHSEYRIEPEQFASPFTMNLILRKPFGDDLLIEGLCGCGQAPSWRFVLQNGRDNIENLFNRFIELDKQGQVTSREGHQFVQECLNIGEDLTVEEDRVVIY